MKNKPKTLLPNPTAKIRNVSEGNPERSSVKQEKEISFLHCDMCDHIGLCEVEKECHILWCIKNDIY